MDDLLGGLFGLLFLAAAALFGGLFIGNTSVNVGSTVVVKSGNQTPTRECRYFTGTDVIKVDYWANLVPACPRWHSLALK